MDKEKAKELSGESISKQKVREALYGEHNSRGRGRSQAEKRKSYGEYRDRKKKVYEFEATNTQYLALYPASDKDTNKKKFYNMGGTSAIIYVHEIGPRIGRKPVLRTDLDNGKDNEKFRSGITSIADLGALEVKLAEIGIKRVKTKDQDLILFKLKREYPASEVKAMLREESKRIENLNKLIYSNVLYPDVHRQILELKKLIPVKVKNMDKTYRETIGYKMIDALMGTVTAYSQLAHGDIPEVEGAKRILLETDVMLSVVGIFAELQLWELSTCIRLAENIAGLRQLTKGRIINKQKNEVNK